MGFAGVVFIIMIVLVVGLIAFPKLSKYYDSINDHFDIKDEEDVEVNLSDNIIIEEEKGDSITNDKG